jgi:hypothetical protein
VEAVPPVPLIARLRILLALADLGWFFWVVYRTGFEEGLVFLAGILCVALLLTLFARFSARIRRPLVVVLIVANLVAGLFFIAGSRLLQERRSVSTQAVIDHAAEALSKFRAHSGYYPGCPWSCMTEELEKYRFWVGDIRYVVDGRKVTEYLPHVPPRDPWGCKYAYVILPGKSGFALSSSGPDRRFGTDDDLKRETRESPFGTRAAPTP